MGHADSLTSISNILTEQEILEACVSSPPFSSAMFNPHRIHIKWRRHWKLNGQWNSMAWLVKARSLGSRAVSAARKKRKMLCHEQLSLLHFPLLSLWETDVQCMGWPALAQGKWSAVIYWWFLFVPKSLCSRVVSQCIGCWVKLESQITFFLM